MSMSCWTSNDTLIHRFIRSLKNRSETVFDHCYCSQVEIKSRKSSLKSRNYDRINDHMFFCQSVLFLNQGNAPNLIVNLNKKCFSIVLILRQNSTFVISTEIAFVIGLMSIFYLYRNKSRKQLTEEVR